MKIEKAAKFIGEYIDSTLSLDVNKRIGGAYTVYSEDKLVGITTQVLEDWIKLSHSNPQAIIDAGRNLIAQNTNLTTLLSNWKIVNKVAYSTKSQMSALSAYYEMASLLAFPVSVMIQGGHNKMNFEKEEIFKHFKAFGLTGALKEKFRIIRNANSHSIELSNEGECIVYNNVAISFQEIFEIYRIVARIFKWYFKLLQSISIGYPKVGLLFIYGIYFEIKSDKDHYKYYFKFLRKIAPDFPLEKNKEQINPKKKEPKKEKGLMFSIKYFLEHV